VSDRGLPRVVSSWEDLEPDNLAATNRPQMTDPDLHLDTARTAARALADRNRHSLTMLEKPLRLDHELVEDVKLRFDRLPDRLEAVVPAAIQRLGGLKPLEVL
jgi:hypothetical protein